MLISASNKRTLIDNVIAALAHLAKKTKSSEFHVMCDGIAPLEKLNEMRRRRRSHQCHLRKALTYGTVFFNELLDAIENNANYTVYFDGGGGEGELKIFKELKTLEKATKVAIYSNDTDMINLAMLANRGKHEIVQFRARGAKFTRLHAKFDAVRIDQLERHINRDFGSVELLMMVCSLHGTDYNQPVIEAPLFETIRDHYDGSSDNESIDNQFLRTVKRACPFVDDCSPEEESSQTYAMIKQRARGEISNRIIPIKHRVSVVDILSGQCVKTGPLKKRLDEAVGFYMSDPLYQGILLFGREWAKYYTSSIELTSELKKKLDRSVLSEDDFVEICNQLQQLNTR